MPELRHTHTCNMHNLGVTECNIQRSPEPGPQGARGPGVLTGSDPGLPRALTPPPRAARQLGGAPHPGRAPRGPGEPRGGGGGGFRLTHITGESIGFDADGRSLEGDEKLSGSWLVSL